MKVGILLSALLGIAISTGSPFGLAVSILAPVVFLRQNSRAAAEFCAIAYYLAALRDLPLVSRNFFGPTSGLLEGFSLWIVAASLLSLPWLWAWSKSEAAALWSAPIALLLSVVPPLGLIGWASPLAASGLLFPAKGFLGLAVTLLMPGLLVIGTAEIVFGFLVLVLCAQLTAPSPALAPSGWVSVDTHFGDVAATGASLVSNYRIGHELQRFTDQSKGKVVVFPEAIAESWTGQLLDCDDKVVLMGATAPVDQVLDLSATIASLQGTPLRQFTIAPTSYKNELLIRGAETGEFLQRVPIPLGMWKPFTQSGVPMNLSGPGSIVIAGERVAPIICYEQLIAWPVLMSFLEHPSIIVAISNSVWVAGTHVPGIEQTNMRAWAALFHLPVLFASNS